MSAAPAELQQLTETIPKTYGDPEAPAPAVGEEESVTFEATDPFALFVGFMQVLFLVLFWCVTTYKEDETTDPDFNYHFLYYLGISIMMLVGFGYLMTFLGRHGLSAVGFTFVITMLCVETDILAGGFWNALYHNSWNKIEVDITAFVNGNFAAAACLISFGALIGKAGMQCLAPLFVLESIFYALNAQVIQPAIGLEDIGGTILIHMFGAYFGLSASMVLGHPESEEANSPNRTSDVTSLIGTVFLWIFWPTFNGFGADPNSGMQQRVVVNTMISLTSCCVWTFVLTKTMHKKKFEIVDVQNATLAGGVMVGVVSNYKLYPAGACFVGMIAATVSVFAYNIITPKITKNIVHDTCGVHNLHGLPSVAGALTSIIMCTWQKSSDYSTSDWNSIFPHGNNQWWHQLLGAMATLGLAITSGAGSMMVCKMALQDTGRHKFKDHVYWTIEYEDIRD